MRVAMSLGKGGIATFLKEVEGPNVITMFSILFLLAFARLTVVYSPFCFNPRASMPSICNGFLGVL